ncbi:hypothetical protein Hanom_Chr07g00679101 [Helianthus anomalus]
MEGDNVPIKPPSERFKWVTLWWRWLHVTPCHWQKLVLEWFHEVKRPCGSPLIMDLMESSARRSPVVPLCAAVVWMSLGRVAKCMRMTKRNN